MMGTIFDIKEFSVHDGPGSRVTVFLKGCPLRCLWCHNPEGLKPEKQLMQKDAMCVHCGQCTKGCDHPECQIFGKCIHICPNQCLEITGREISARELAEKLIAYQPILNTGEGGITFSGGEPLMQPEFLCEVIDLMKEKCDIHIAIQTSGYTSEEIFARVIEKVDYIMMDLKLADRELHKKYIGVDNDRILNNFRYLRNSGKEYVVRIPLIPDITDTRENLMALSAIIEDSPCELLRYNHMAPAKYGMLGMKYLLEAKKNNEIDISIFQNLKSYRK